MRKKQPYKSLLHTLQMLKKQAVEGVPYMVKNVPKYIRQPEDLFYFLADNVTYKNDPKKVELIHTARSFWDDNFHGKPGHGDCDDFTCISISALKAIGVPEKDMKIVLTGRTPKIAKHIYLKVRETPFDLTNNLYGQERKYPYVQNIPLKLL